MSNYIITRDQLIKRFSDGGATSQESDRIISAIFSYLELIANRNVGFVNVNQPIELVFYDFRFLYSLYTNDEFAKRFFSVYRDVVNHLITFSSLADENDHIIRESTGLNNGENGLYLYILNFDKNVMSAKISSATSFNIVNPGEDVFSKSLSTGSSIDSFKSPVIPRSDDRRSYTDSVMSITPSLPTEIDTTNLPDDYKNIKGTDSLSVPFLNGNPGSVAADRVRTSKSGVVKKDSINSTRSDVLDSSSSINVDGKSKFPVLDFILKTSRVRQ